MNMLFYCFKCRTISSRNDIPNEPKCKVCSNDLIPLNCSKEEWNNYSETKMFQVICDATSDYLNKHTNSSEEKTEEYDLIHIHNNESDAEPEINPEPLVKEEHKERKQNIASTQKPVDKKKVIIILSISSLLFLGLFAVIIAGNVNRDKQNNEIYNSIIQYEQTGKYDEALKLCSKLVDYDGVEELQSRLQSERNNVENGKCYETIQKRFVNVDTASTEELEKLLSLIDSCDGYDLSEEKNTVCRRLAKSYFSTQRPADAYRYLDLISDLTSEDIVLKNKCNNFMQLSGSWSRKISSQYTETVETVEFDGCSADINVYNVNSAGKYTLKNHEVSLIFFAKDMTEDGEIYAKVHSNYKDTIYKFSLPEQDKLCLVVNGESYIYRRDEATQEKDIDSETGLTKDKKLQIMGYINGIMDPLNEDVSLSDDYLEQKAEQTWEEAEKKFGVTESDILDIMLDMDLTKEYYAKNTKSVSSNNTVTDYQAELKSNGYGLIVIATSKSALDEYIGAVGSDNSTIDLLQSTGQIATAAEGTKINVVDAGLGTSAVKILEGPNKGATVYVISEQITFR